MFVIKHCFIRLRGQDIKTIGAEVFGELRNVVLEENGEDKMVRESKHDLRNCAFTKKQLHNAINKLMTLYSVSMILINLNRFCRYCLEYLMPRGAEVVTVVTEQLPISWLQCSPV